MRAIALPLGLIFIFYLLRKDIKESPHTSAALWIPFVWMAVAASRPISLWLRPNNAASQATDFNYLQGSATERNFLIVLICAGLFVLIRRRHKFAFPFRQNSALYVLFIYAMLSISWADYQGVAIKRWIRGIGDIIMILVVLTEEDQREAVEHVLRRCAIVLIPLSVVFVRWVRSFGVVFHHTGSPMWVGVATHKNNLALLCSFVGLLLIWRMVKAWPKPNIWDLFLFVLTLYLLQGARSATSLVVLLLGSLVLAIEALAKGNPKRLTALVLASLAALMIFQGILTSIGSDSISGIFFSATGRNTTFTDRVPLWQELIRIGSRKPILGAGFGSFWMGGLTYDLWSKFQWKPTNGHNGYIDTFLELGLLGLVFLLFFIVQTFIKARNSVEPDWGIGRLQFAFVIMILLHNVTETSMAMPTSFLWILFLMASMVVIKKPAGGEVEAPPPTPPLVS